MKFRHVGIVPKDINSSIEFYTDLLGFKKEKDILEVGEFVNKICGLEGISVRTVKMSLDGEIVLELLEFGNNKETSKSREIMEHGYTHMAITVTDIEEIYNLLKEKVEFTTHPLTSPDKKAKVTFCKDPDGNLIELVQEIK